MLSKTRLRFTMLHLYFALAICQAPAPSAPEPPQASPEVAPAQVTLPSEVQELLAKVATAQWRDKPGPPLHAFAIHLNLRDRSGDTPREIEAKIRFRAEHGGLVRIQLHDPNRGLRITKGFDGKQYWLAEDNQPVVNLGGREFAQDRKSIDHALAMCQDLMLLLDPHQIPQVATKVSLIKSESEVGFRAQLSRENRPWEFQVLLSKNHLPKSLLMLPLWKNDSGETPQSHQFQMSYYKEFQGRRLPQVIEEFLGKDKKMPARIYELRDFYWENRTLIQVSPPPVTREPIPDPR